jgi:DNA adenine methylase
MIETLVWRDCPVVIPYFGGKFELSRKLVPMLAKHNRYLEVFAGGLSMFFRKKKAKLSVLNDIDNDVVNLYTVVLYHFDEMCEFIFWMPKARLVFEEAQERILSSKEMTIPDIERACLYYYVIRNSFNKNPYLNMAPNTARKDWKHLLKEELIQSREHLDGSLIENLDFRTFIKRYKPKDGDMWYFDPPYVVAGERGDYYYYDFTTEMHNDLAEKCKEINNDGGKFMVSYDDKETIRELYKDFNIKTVNTIYAGGSNKLTISELVIMNYEPISQTEIFDKGDNNDRQNNGDSSI